jgi:hypothetical protein
MSRIKFAQFSEAAEQRLLVVISLSKIRPDILIPTVSLSRLASDLDGVMIACDLNTVAIRKGSGDVRIVAAFCVCA